MRGRCGGVALLHRRGPGRRRHQGADDVHGRVPGRSGARVPAIGRHAHRAQHGVDRYGQCRLQRSVRHAGRCLCRAEPVAGHLHGGRRGHGVVFVELGAGLPVGRDRPGTSAADIGEHCADDADTEPDHAGPCIDQRTSVSSCSGRNAGNRRKAGRCRRRSAASGRAAPAVLGTAARRHTARCRFHRRRFRRQAAAFRAGRRTAPPGRRHVEPVLLFQHHHPSRPAGMGRSGLPADGLR